jgi:hypothetical protein
VEDTTGGADDVVVVDLGGEEDRVETARPIPATTMAATSTTSSARLIDRLDHALFWSTA